MLILSLALNLVSSLSLLLIFLLLVLSKINDAMFFFFFSASARLKIFGSDMEMLNKDKRC